MEGKTFIAINNGGIARAECASSGEWIVSHALSEVRPVVLAADPGKRGVVYAGTQDNGIFRTTNGGQSWASVGLDGQVVKSIAVSPHDSRIIYAGVRPASMYKSSDGGRSWQELASFRRIRNRWWWFSPAEKPWKPYVMAIAISPTEPDVVLAGIEFGAVVRSDDGGRTWSGHRRGAIRDCHSLKFHATNGKWVYEAGGTGGGAAVSRDGGLSWSQPRGGLAKHYGVACAADPERPEVWYVGLAPGPGKAYGANSEAYLYRSSGGADWQPIGWELPPMNEMPLALVTLPSAPRHLYASTTRGSVWHSADYGDTWRKLPFNLGSGAANFVIT